LQFERFPGRRIHPDVDSSRVVRTTGIAFGWIAPTSLFGSVVRNAKISFVVSPSFTFRTDVQRVQTPAKKAKWPGIVEGEPNRRTRAVWQDSFSEKLVRTHSGSRFQASAANAEI